MGKRLLLVVLGLILVFFSQSCTQVAVPPIINPAASLPATNTSSAPADQKPAPTITASPLLATGKASVSSITSQVTPIQFSTVGHTTYGDWIAESTLSNTNWQPGASINVKGSLIITDDQVQKLIKANIIPDGWLLLITAERTFDPNGWLRLASDERMSTLLTPSGLPIEGGTQSAVTNRFGADWKTPVDEFKTIPMTTPDMANTHTAFYDVTFKLPNDLPPGIYRLRMDYGFTSKKRNYSLNAESFAYRPGNQTPPALPVQTYTFSPPARASGTYVSGAKVDASAIQPRIPWTILNNYGSNGYSGVVADEDRSHFALSPRNIIADDVILPLYNTDNKTLMTYSLEPQFPEDSIDAACNILWDYYKGQTTIEVTGPDGKTAKLGTFSFIGKNGLWPTTKNAAVTAWKPSVYGYYTVKETGWINDIWGNRYEGGGTYHFWIAKRMTLATATFQGQAYPVGTKYGRDMAFDPAVPADVTMSASLYPSSDPGKVKTVSSSGKATIGGIFGVAQGMQQLTLDSPGEYYARMLVKYTDQEGHLWVEGMTHAGVVYATDTTIVAHGKKLSTGGKLVDEGNTNTEGYVETNGVAHLQHINYPYLAGDVLEIAADHQGANKIEPVLTYDSTTNPILYDPAWQSIGQTNIKFKTSNGYSPHLFPEYITDLAYYYSAAPRPGFMSRFIIAENGTRAPYWPTSPNSFGGQVAASSNGDMPGVIYRLIGGVVIRKQNTAPAYAGYMANGFVLPDESKNNRIVKAGSEDLLGSDGTKSRFFLVSTRPGMIYEVGASFTAVAQIDPMLSATITYTMVYPDGRTVVAQGQGDSFGNFAAKDKWILDIPGIYHYNIVGDWQGYQGYMPGLPKEGGNFYVVEKDKPFGAPGLKLNLAEQSSFSASGTLTITGTSTASSISFAALTPGAAMDGGTIPVSNGKFTYTFDPAAMAAKVPLYDIVNLTTGKPEIKSVVQLTFFSKETTSSGAIYHSAVRVILRGTTVLYVY